MDLDHGTFRLLYPHPKRPTRELYRSSEGWQKSELEKSLIGTVQTSLAYGSVYFNAYPHLQISLNDENSLNTLILSIKLHDYDYLHETNFSKSKVITTSPIKWDDIDFPKKSVIKEAVPLKNNINPDISDIEQTPDGTVRIKFTDQNLLMSYADNIGFPSRILRSNSSYISTVDYIVDMPSRASTSQIREEDNSRVSTSYMKEGKRVDNIKIENHIVTPDMDPTLSEKDFPNDLHG
ncbi:hypothetical protein H5410_060479 [Solanum commersonii]|uniref:Uncharacterized protein n=1 Tax=Solanum commersonii TaxID=4109 RepID=A0A9J5W5J1_SOLCO|nr:hypothetical protein H5410_060479 [Solanum commersonii]